MKITEEAKTIITEALKSNDCDCSNPAVELR